MKKDNRDPDRKYIFPNEDMVNEEAERKSEDVQAQKSPDSIKKDEEPKK